MVKIPIKPIMNVAKNATPIVTEYVKKHPGKTLSIISVAGKASKEFLDKKEARFEKKQNKGKIHYRKIQHLKYHNEILPKLDTYSYIQLNSFKQEVETYIKQINQEEENQLAINKPLHTKRIKSWDQIRIQIEDKIKTKNYEELLKAFNSPSYESIYFDAKVINGIRSIDDTKEVHNYVYLYTEKDIKNIEIDFS
ncbi:hypothetical protein GLW07_13570 [Bacillus hwajinpoensis]|uniref:Uncharacterized protein n=1 Tax=Guptibacillus hwajinpoensis TaxID=208199 RepID=A0A845F0Q4_9BACL|nr:hypothetical protein [Pseudalkalibacillus hwajinpoensis]MYL64380.1 hypothetical protein [Pseudalkalibacillus hwajinpoensis]